MIQEIMSNTEKFYRKISELRKVSPVYPDMHCELKDRVLWVSTMVKFTYNGVKFKRHHVESAVYDGKISFDDLKKVLEDQAQKTVDFGVPCSLDDIIGI